MEVHTYMRRPEHQTQVAQGNCLLLEESKPYMNSNFCAEIHHQKVKAREHALLAFTALLQM